MTHFFPEKNQLCTIGLISCTGQRPDQLMRWAVLCRLANYKIDFSRINSVILIYIICSILALILSSLLKSGYSGHLLGH